MAITAVATLQTPWDCKWSQPGYRLTGVAEALQPESLWVCTRTAERRAVCETDCENCPYWEMDDSRTVALTLSLDATVLAAPALAESAWDVHAVGRAGFRVMLILAAVVFVYSGFALLTTPLALPITWTLWACAAAMSAFAIWGRFPDPEAR